MNAALMYTINYFHYMWSFKGGGENECWYVLVAWVSLVTNGLHS